MSARKGALELREAASRFAEAIAHGEGEAIEATLHARTVAFDAFMELAVNGIDADTQQIVDEVVALDGATQEQARAQLGEVREELQRIRHVRRVVIREAAPEVPRFVSRRA